VTGGISDYITEDISIFTATSKATAGKQIIVDGLLVQTVPRDGNSLFRSLRILLEDEGRYNRLRQKAVGYSKFI
jgi:hypothetical protein